ncbi:S41 family peptidase [Flavobacterium lacus]|uniref:C-terminal processing protease CtpA/Prc n=1 Tax=Flavobacterium lacus TaxID=1353778 RepID=A0A328WQ15_9FLAO|nr:S41 family peptidase [Flavobacterium lacus]RAR47345.1 C-terminal processing protease CtpA/Prc [Flavobacterium lacus]
MKKILLLILFFVSQIAIANTKVNTQKKVESFIQIWGLLKYHHPEVSKGKYDFNNEFLLEFEKIQLIDNQEELNNEFLNWIKKFDGSKISYKSDDDFFKRKNLHSKNTDFKWINNSNFTNQLIEILTGIKNNAVFGDYYASINSLNKMVGFKNETGLNNFDSTLKSHRMLFLSSFWNSMRYWNVNIYLTEQPWSEILTEMIDEFDSADQLKFELSKEKLFSKLNDSHSNYQYSTTLNSLTNFPDFGGRIINDSLVIDVIFNKNKIEKDAMEIGDIIYEIEGLKLREYYLLKYQNVISASNENYLKSAIEKTYLLASNKDSIRVELLKKNGDKQNRYIHLSKLKYFAERYVRQRPTIEVNSKIIEENIGYVNLYKINKQELKTAFKSFENTKGLIIDLRNYPEFISEADIANYLYPNKKKFLKALAPVFPSYAAYDIEAPLKIIKDPFSSGRTNKNFYKGKVVLLVDRKTASKAEFIGMAIQQSPNCITVGEQTFGAVMNRTEVILMDKTTIDFTGVGAFYPNDERVQRNGLKIDYKIKESAINFHLNHYVEEAIKIINQ